MYNNILKNPLIKKLSLVQFISYFGGWFTNVAVYTMILHFQVSPVTNALVVSMYALPALLAPINGALVEKYLSKNFMLFLLCVELLTSAMLLMIDDRSLVWFLMLILYIRTTASFLFFNSEMSMLPQILSSDELKKANELHSIIWSATFALGMAIGGIVVDRFGVYNTIKIDILLFIIAIALFWGIKIELARKSKESIKLLILQGLNYLKKHKRLHFFILIHATVAFTNYDTLINLLTNDRYKEFISIPLAIGILNATRAFGLMVGPIFIGKKIRRSNLDKFFLLQGGVIILWSIVEFNFYLSVAMMFMIGFFTTTLWSYTYTLIQEEIESNYLGRVLAYNEMIFMSVSIMTALFTGVSYKFGLSLPIITFLLGSVFIIVAMLYKSKSSMIK